MSIEIYLNLKELANYQYAYEAKKFPSMKRSHIAVSVA